MKSLITNNKTTIIRILLFVVIAIIVYLTARLKFSIDKIRDNWTTYKCKYPYSLFGGYLSPNGIKDEDGDYHTGMKGSKINQDECNKDITTTFLGGVMAPLYVSYGNDIKNLRKQKENLSMMAKYTESFKETIGASFKKVFKFLLVIYYIIIYIFQKIKLILFKIQGVLDVILDTFKVYVRFINYFIFTLLPLYMKWQVSMLTLSISKTLMSLTGGLIKGSMGAAITSLFASGVGAAFLPFMAVLSAVAAGVVYFTFLWFMGQAKDFLQTETQFSGIGNLPPLPALEGWAYDYDYDPITGKSKDKFAQNQKIAAGSMLNIIAVIIVSLKGELKNDTSTCLTKNTLIKLKNCSMSIENCAPGDILNNGEIILGLMKYEPKMVQLYDYRGVTMTGTHYIQVNKNNYAQCKDIGIPRKKSYETLYCPVTSNGKLQAGGDSTIDIADYNDFKTFAEWNFEVDRKLNSENNYSYNDYLEHDYAPLFVDKSIIKQNQKIGSIKYVSDNIKLYNYKDIILSGSVLVFEDDTWKRIWQTNARPVKNNNKYLYNIVTENHTIEINNILFRDFEELD